VKTQQNPIVSLEEFADIDVEEMAAAFEADAGESLPEIREALADAKAGRFARVTTPEQLFLREARRKTGMSQSEFARRIKTPVSTLRDWEQGRFSPPGIATVLARLITKHPELVSDLAA
jgi:putative transcriptional regulator